MEFIPSPKGNKQLLVLNRHIYGEQKKLAGNVILWDCLNRRKANSCDAKVKTLNGVLQGRLHHHTHPAEPEKVEVMKVRGAMKQRAQNTMEQTSRRWSARSRSFSSSERSHAILGTVDRKETQYHRYPDPTTDNLSSHKRIVSPKTVTLFYKWTVTPTVREC